MPKKRKRHDKALSKRSGKIHNPCPRNGVQQNPMAARVVCSKLARALAGLRSKTVNKAVEFVDKAASCEML
ncbi:hypothetical protein [Acidithiobacillus sp. HP-11]|uniref:hypothetical protein n=1 Tax=Acidithiobacillus sp. HP-11 TaxID=2697656 RepID=UPI00187A4716|nr:hypothetical protein [Acidithiobacillus sp. HP-11]MBE7566817.1 hypothetical protein [Acidithiobacillus sp. HP-11]